MFLHLSVSHSVHWGMSASVHSGIHTPLGRQPPCPVHVVIDMDTAVGGMHPTGMHSCLFYFIVFVFGGIFSGSFESL